MTRLKLDTETFVEVIASIQTQHAEIDSVLDNLRATILRAQLPQLDANCARWNERYRALEQRLAELERVNMAGNLADLESQER